ncbi:hypothetical protein [Borreliella americana]|uniref:hypothetical protein n=1 Tax=Borreliella americana TaxID=478807 RepID=UPI001E45C391|nr:hypothetical protein [Borreliella americana]MCD2332691.1 hypothetical protein [Borreliella americana]MCD2382092.1 hypothetical protein [Borreliella americana]
MIKGNTFILILLTTMFVSCKFYGSDDANKKNTSLSGTTVGISNIGSVILEQDGNKKGDTTTSKVALAQVTDHANSKPMLADDPDSSVSKYDQKNTTGKLNEEDMDKLKTFFGKTITYQGTLDSIYNKYTRSYNTIATYSGCADYGIECFSEGPSARRSQALTNLENNQLDKEYSKLNKMLKQAATGYDDSTLNSAINKYKEVIKRAKEAENHIEKENDYAETKKAGEEKKKKNLDNLKTVKDVLSVSEKTIETASVAYANAFAVIASGLSSAEFITAVNEFKEAAEKYANGNKGDHAIDVIVGAITGIALDNENRFQRANMFANKETGEEVDKMIAAIEKLRTIYNAVKPKNKDK